MILSRSALIHRFLLNKQITKTIHSFAIVLSPADGETAVIVTQLTVKLTHLKIRSHQKIWTYAPLLPWAQAIHSILLNSFVSKTAGIIDSLIPELRWNGKPRG